MWTATAFNGTWREVPVVALEGVPFTSAAVLERASAADLLNAPGLISHLAQEVEIRGASRDAIELWAAAAAAQSGEFDWESPNKIVALEEAIALFPKTSETDLHPTTIAWHDRTTVIVPFSANDERVVLEYTPFLRDELRVKRLTDRYAGPDHTLETVLDWRGYFGTSSAVIDHWTAMRRNGRSFVVSLIGTGGFAVGSVARRLTRPQPTLEHDPTRHGRLVTMLERHRHIEAQCPDLRAVPRVTHPRVAVFVHGTVSCGVQGLKDLIPPAGNAWGPIYRYEHDTFRPVDENAAELAGLIAERVDTPQLLIAGHSRGGLVARAAAAALDNSRAGQTEVWTFGTPHVGTPLVAIGGRLMNLLLKLGEDMAGAVPVLSPLAKGYGYLLDSPTLPAGILAMSEDSPALGMLNLIPGRFPIRAWGSSFDIHGAASGFAVGVGDALAGALHGRLHDLVVPTASALGVGAAQPTLDCSHVHYFAEPAIRTAFGEFFSAPAPAQDGGISIMKPLVLQKRPGLGGV